MCFRADVFRCNYEISERQRGCSEQPRGGAGGVGGEEEREEQSRGWQRQRGAGGGVAERRSGGMRQYRATGLKGVGRAGRAGRGASGWAGLPPRGRTARAAEVHGRVQLCPSAFLPNSCPSLSVMTFLLFLSAVAVSRAQVQQDPSAETSEGTGINITCSHPNNRGRRLHAVVPSAPGPRPRFPRQRF